jgi:RNA-directed DNA polymerase
MERVGESETRRRAWKRVKANQGAPGVEGMTLDAADTWVRMHWPTVRESRLQGPDHPLPLRRTAIPTPSGGARGLGIPAGIDRVIQQALRQGLTPIVDPECSASSFGVRPQRSAHGAVRQVQAFLRNGYRVAVDLDLEQVVDRVHHDGLMVRVARTGADTRVVARLGRSLRAGVRVDGVGHPTTWGTPHGGPVSPRLANILLDDLDQGARTSGPSGRPLRG